MVARGRSFDAGCDRRCRVDPAAGVVLDRVDEVVEPRLGQLRDLARDASRRVPARERRHAQHRQHERGDAEPRLLEVVVRDARDAREQDHPADRGDVAQLIEQHAHAQHERPPDPRRSLCHGVHAAPQPPAPVWLRMGELPTRRPWHPTRIRRSADAPFRGRRKRHTTRSPRGGYDGLVASSFARSARSCA
jgi:hypothetical protein